MRRFEYQVTKHPAHNFSQIVYFCSEQGECSFDQLPSHEISVLGDILNENGTQGWELVQIFFGKDGAIALWKREIENL